MAVYFTIINRIAALTRQAAIDTAYMYRPFVSSVCLSVGLSVGNDREF